MNYNNKVILHTSSIKTEKWGAKMSDEITISKVKTEINSFNEKFKDISIDQIKDGTWFARILSEILTVHAQKVNAEYFKKKYIGLTNEKIAYQLIRTTANYTAIAGGTVAGAITGAEFMTFFKGKKVAAALGISSFIGEIAYISYMQLKLIYDISIVMDARLDKDDPEDMLTIFWYGLGINVWENIGNAAIQFGAKSTEYLGRKILRAGIRKAMVQVVGKVGGQKLGAKLTEKALLKFIVPGVNIPVAFYLNRSFTKKIGEKALESFRTRGVLNKTLDKLVEFERFYQILAVPLIFQIGICDENNKYSSRNIEMQNNVVNRLIINSNEEKEIDRLIEIDFTDFCKILSEIENDQTKQCLFEVAAYSFLMSSFKDETKFDKLSKALCIDLNQVSLENYKLKIGLNNKILKRKNSRSIFIGKKTSNVEIKKEKKHNT